METLPYSRWAALAVVALLLLHGMGYAATGPPAETARDTSLDGRADPEGPAPKSPQENEPWHIEARRLTFFHATDVVMGSGAVRVRRGDLTVSAEHMVYDRQRAQVWASGQVTIQLGQDVLTGEEGELNLETATGTVKGGHLFLERNNIHLLARRLWKTGPEEYRAEEATVSTCPLPKQAWSFSCRDLTLTVGGLAIGRHDTFNIRDIPVLYSPWVVLPINRYRKTGFLLPYFSQSRRNGTEINVPFFWAINDSMDATFYQHPMVRRGWMEGAELRYILSEESRGILRYNLMVDTLEDSDYNSDGFVRGNEKRWWLRAKADQQILWGLEAKVDLDLISDRDYLQEFSDGPMGFDQTNKLFRNNFGRSLSDDTDLIRPSTVQVTKRATDFFGGGEARYNDNQILGEQDGTVQTLPRFILHGFSQPLSKTPLFYDWEASYVHYWREAGIKEERLHLEPRVSLPVEVFGLADLVLSGTLEETLYEVSGDDPIQEPSAHPNRLLYTLEADLSTTLSRRFERPDGGAFLHTIRPALTYRHRPSRDQDDLPQVDALDRLQATDRITISLLSFLSSRSRSTSGRLVYADLVRFRVEQSYDPEREGLMEFARLSEGRRFSDILAEIEFRPAPNLFLRYDTTYSVYGEGFTTYNLWGHMATTAGSTLDLTYRYNRTTDINELHLGLWIALSDSLYGMYDVRRSFSESTELESTYGLRYQSACWALDFQLIRNKDENRFTVNLELLGIGGWGRLN